MLEIDCSEQNSKSELILARFLLYIRNRDKCGMLQQ